MFHTLRAKIDLKFMAVLALVLTLVMAGQIGGYILMLNQVLAEQEGRVQMLQETNQQLRDQVFTLQEGYLEIPQRLEANPLAALQSWAEQNGATTVRHEGRENIVKRFKKRKLRRDLGKQGRVVVDEFDGGPSLAFGLFEAGESKNTVLEFRLKDLTLADVQARVDQIILENEGADALKRKIALLKSDMADAGLAAENSRMEILAQFDRIKEKDAQVMGFVDQVKQMVTGSGLLAILVAIAAAYMVGRFLITRSLVRLRNALQDISENKDVELPEVHRVDEIGALAEGLHQIQHAQKESNRLRASRDAEREKGKRKVEERLTHVNSSLERGMKTSMRDLSQRADDMMAQAAQLTQLAGRNQNQADEAGRLAGENAETADRILNLAHDLVGNGDRMSQAVDQQRQLTGLAARDVAQSQKTVGDLQQAAAQVEEIVQIIQDIAGQTNLLALNATIEATRAGAAGSGFAVVASEVKKLSAETAKSTQEISSRIQAIRTVAGNAARAIATIEDRIGDVNRSMGDLTRSCSSQIEASRSIAGFVQNSVDNAGRVSASTGDMREAAEISGQAANQISGAMGGVVQALGNMREELLGILRAASSNGVDAKTNPVRKTPLSIESTNVTVFPAAAE